MQLPRVGAYRRQHLPLHFVEAGLPRSRTYFLQMVSKCGKVHPPSPTRIEYESHSLLWSAPSLSTETLPTASARKPPRFLRNSLHHARHTLTLQLHFDFPRFVYFAPYRNLSAQIVSFDTLSGLSIRTEKAPLNHPLKGKCLPLRSPPSGSRRLCHFARSLST